jgi:hypothetical protein
MGFFTLKNNMRNKYNMSSKTYLAPKDTSFISTQPFNNEFYTYTVSMNLQFRDVGTFTSVNGANATTCPSGRILHATGKKLIPGMDPGVNTLLLSVYDPASFLTGFINPSSATFAKYDQNLPSSFDTGYVPAAAALGGQGASLRLPSCGVVSLVDETYSANIGDSLTGTIRLLALVGSGGYVNVNGNAIRSTSKIFLSPSRDYSGSPLKVGPTIPVDGQFKIFFADSGYIDFLIVN